MKVLITGATGLLGREIGKVLAEHGHEIVVISRSLAKAREVLPFPCEVVLGDLSKGPIHDSRLEGIEGVINLMGEPVVSRWDSEKKAAIYNSRVEGTKHLIASLPSNLQVFVSSTAIGYYGNDHETIQHEENPPGDNFLAKVCIDWEKEISKAPGRKAIIRTGIVLSSHGGAMDQMLYPFRLGIGGPLGDGQQWMSWIHIKDIVGLFVFALENTHVTGPINGCAPNPVRNKEFSKSLANALGKSMGPSMPLFVLKLYFGEVSDVLTVSIRGSAERSKTLGYKFQYDDVNEALKDVCAPYQNGEDFYYAEQFIPDPPEKVFPFFKEAHNLEEITPPTLNFKIEKVSTSEITQGTLIDYTLKIRGIPAKWKTEIDEWQPPYKFVDNQLKGPYSLWRHTHEFRPFCGGTLLVDKVKYRLPLGQVGWIFASKLVSKDIDNIFSFRRKYIANMTVPRKG
ncbi:TIGR01777 family oxidoreductase [Bdellovibrio reynosensis]|uniref:TIGR01777 family oxidoreductase n=1 Tax=Bdellovibrio reynosensis TaxID=2835041 RepID=A0ABY4CA24_9BACT|nr:TIGR01777 family oxidoreductase [Bdellovibrio reynosensis]UOF01822.1 TIGR01777 family oxidoreductase [Bdellovibrio reynosensis]